MENQSKIEWEKPVLEVLNINMTRNGKSSNSQDGVQGGDETCIS